MESLDQMSTKVFGPQDPPDAIPAPAMSFRRWLYAWLLDPHIEHNHHRTVDRWIGILIIANLFALLFEHVPAIYEPNKDLFHVFDVFSVVIFTLEYLVRFYLAPEDEEFKQRKHPRWRYVMSPFALIDLVAVAPFYLQAFIPVDLRVLRFLRLLRMLKLFRVLVPAYREFVQANLGRTFRQKLHARSGAGWTATPWAFMLPGTRTCWPEELARTPRAFAPDQPLMKSWPWAPVVLPVM